MNNTILPFHINVAQSALDDLKTRLRQTRWPDEMPGKFETIELKKSSKVKIQLLENVNIENVAVILYVQHPRTLKISGAAKINLT